MCLNNSMANLSRPWTLNFMYNLAVAYKCVSLNPYLFGSSGVYMLGARLAGYGLLDHRVAIAGLTCRVSLWSTEPALSAGRVCAECHTPNRSCWVN